MFPISDGLKSVVSSDAWLSDYPGAQHGPHTYNGQVYIPLFTDTGIQMFKSSDEGATWAAVGTGPDFQRTYKSVDAPFEDVVNQVEVLASASHSSKIYVVHLENVSEDVVYSPVARLVVSTFDTLSDTWTSTSDPGPVAHPNYGPSDYVTKRIYCAYRLYDNSIVVLYGRSYVNDAAYWNPLVSDTRVGRVGLCVYNLSAALWGSEVNMFEAGTSDSWDACGICAGDGSLMHCVARSDPQGGNVATTSRLRYAHQSLVWPTSPASVQVVVESNTSYGRPSPCHPGSVELSGTTYVYFMTQGQFIPSASVTSVWCAASEANPTFSESTHVAGGGAGPGTCGALQDSAVVYFNRSFQDEFIRGIGSAGCSFAFGTVGFTPAIGAEYIETISVGVPYAHTIAFAALDFVDIGGGIYRDIHRPVHAIVTISDSEEVGTCCCVYDSGGG